MRCVFLQQMTAAQGYVWFLPGWYTQKWWDTDTINEKMINARIECTSEEMLEVKYNYLEQFNLLGGDKVSMLTCTYVHKPLRKSEVTRLLSHFTWCLIWWFADIKKSVVIHDTESSYWDQVSVNGMKLKTLLRKNVATWGGVQFIKRQKWREVT